jgi:HD-GYP domain-containing protein (c-di-GMP phosphodiesterase class II)
MPPLRLAELLASLSLATDLSTGQPLGHGMRTCLLSVRIARELGCDDSTVRAVHHVALLRFLGCTADAHETARMSGGDEREFNRIMAPTVMGSGAEMMRMMPRAIAPGAPISTKVKLLAAAIAHPGAAAESLATHCEVASMLARRLQLDDEVIDALGHAYERWDGKGYPSRLRREDVPLAIRISSAATDVDLAHMSGLDPQILLRDRSGKAHDPEVVGAINRIDTRDIEAELSNVVDAEPPPQTILVDVETALSVLADFVDLKSPWTRGHSRKVASLAATAAEHAGQPPSEVEHLRLAALVHDIGRVGVENAVWDKPGKLSTDQWEKVRLHPYLTERILARCPRLAHLAPLAGSHHERADGSGYPKQFDSSAIPPLGELLAAADVFAASTESRPHRPAKSTDEARALLESEAQAQRLDRNAVACVLAAADGTDVPPHHEAPAGLTEREVEVLALIAKGHTNKQTAQMLFIAPKTVGRHIENIYAKIGVSTRAAAAVFAMEHRMLG